MFRQLYRILGPGLFMAAVSVGVSHLVQSTRAGALYGMGMLVFIIFGLATKYPAFRFGQQYAVITGTTLLEGFRQQGKWALILYFFLSLASMFTGLAAVTLVTASLAKLSFSLSPGPKTISAILFGIGFLLLAIGRYHWLDHVIKILVIVMTLSTLTATTMVLPYIDWSNTGGLLPPVFDTLTLFFIATVIGWMPAPLETPVMQSVWVMEKEFDTGIRPDWKLSSLDFHIGYIGTAILAFCFLLLGTAIIYHSGVELEQTAVGFAAQLIAIYQHTLGDWSRLLISIAAFAVMLSTMFTILDAYPRTLATLFMRLKFPETPHTRNTSREMFMVYLVILVTIIIGAMSVQIFLGNSFTTLIGIATTISFISAPLIAWLVHRAIASAPVPGADKPGRGLLFYSKICIFLMGVFAIFYIYLLFNI